MDLGVSGNLQSLTLILFEERHILESGIAELRWDMEQRQEGVLRF